MVSPEIAAIINDLLGSVRGREDSVLDQAQNLRGASIASGRSTSCYIGPQPPHVSKSSIRIPHTRLMVNKGVVAFTQSYGAILAIPKSSDIDDNAKMGLRLGHYNPEMRR